MSVNTSRNKRKQLEDNERDTAIDLSAPLDPQNKAPDRPLARSLLFSINLAHHETIGDGSGTTQKQSDLGTLLSTFEIDFDIHNNRQLFCNVVSDTAITFVNLPSILFCQLRIYIDSANPTITISGSNINTAFSTEIGTLTENDFLDLVLVLSSGAVSVQSVKKNDESEAEDIIPSSPENFTFVGRSPTEIIAKYDIPSEGTLPITFDLAYSTSPSEDSDGAPNHSSVVKINNLTSLEKVITGLNAAQTYYGWIRAKNATGESSWVGGVQTNTDAAVTNSLLGFSITSPDFKTVTISWATPNNRTYKYVLTRSDKTDSLLFYSQAQGYTDTDVIPNTSYTYTLKIYDEYNTLVLTLTNFSVTVQNLPVPTFTLSLLSGRARLSIVIPAGIRIVDYVQSRSAAVDSTGLLTEASRIRQVLKPFNGSLDATHIISVEQSQAPLTTSYWQVRSSYSIFGGRAYSDWSAVQNITTASFNVPRTPDVDDVDIETDYIEIEIGLDDEDDEDNPTDSVVVQLLEFSSGSLVYPGGSTAGFGRCIHYAGPSLSFEIARNSEEDISTRNNRVTFRILRSIIPAITNSPNLRDCYTSSSGDPISQSNWDREYVVIARAKNSVGMSDEVVSYTNFDGS